MRQETDYSRKEMKEDYDIFSILPEIKRFTKVGLLRGRLGK